MIDVKALLDGYASYWWSPVPGTRYSYLGRVSPGAHNLTWALSNETLPRNSPPHNSLRWVHEFSLQVVQGYPVEEWAITLSREKFYHWLVANSKEVEALPWLQKRHNNPKAFVEQLKACTAPKASV